MSAGFIIIHSAIENHKRTRAEQIEKHKKEAKLDEKHFQTQLQRVYNLLYKTLHPRKKADTRLKQEYLDAIGTQSLAWIITRCIKLKRDVEEVLLDRNNDEIKTTYNSKFTSRDKDTIAESIYTYTKQLHSEKNILWQRLDKLVNNEEEIEEQDRIFQEMIDEKVRLHNAIPSSSEYIHTKSLLLLTGILMKLLSHTPKSHIPSGTRLLIEQDQQSIVIDTNHNWCVVYVHINSNEKEALLKDYPGAKDHITLDDYMSLQLSYQEGWKISALWLFPVFEDHRNWIGDHTYTYLARYQIAKLVLEKIYTTNNGQLAPIVDYTSLENAVKHFVHIITMAKQKKKKQ